MSQVRVRFAPSPTGRLHIGGARTALFNWAFARRHGGAFVLRVEDTDEARNTEASLHSILENLRWLGLDWDEGPEQGGDFGPYFQSERKELYGEAVDELRASGRLYRCFCTPERLEELKDRQRAAKQPLHYDRLCRGLDAAESERRASEGGPDGTGEAFTWRFAVEPGQEVVIDDAIRGEVRVRSEEVEDWVAVRSNGTPTYNFCCVVDDAAMSISHVLRGEEHLANTPKQVLLYQALGLDVPRFAHVPLILGKDGKKLSKRQGHVAVDEFRALGYPPEALFNFLSLLGFSIDDHTDVLSADELVAAFDLKRVNKAGAVFDTDKLLWLSGEYIRHTEVPELTDRVIPWLRHAKLVGEELPVRNWLEELVAGERERIRLYSELPDRVRYLFRDEFELEPKAAKALEDADAGRILAAAADSLEQGEFPPADFDAWAKGLCAELDIGMGKLLKPVRASLSGMLGGRPVGEMLALLGRERTLARLRAVPAAS